MSPVSRGYLTGGLFFAVTVGGLCFLASHLGTKYVDQVIYQKFEQRVAVEGEATRVFEALRRRDPKADLSKLEKLAALGYPKVNTLLAWTYDERSMISSRDAQVMRSLDTMIDPDLLMFLGFVARSFDEEAQSEAYDRIMAGGINRNTIYASMQTRLSEADLKTLRGCYAKLQAMYSEDEHGQRSIRYAYFNDTMSCRTPKGTQDANQAGA